MEINVGDIEMQSALVKAIYEASPEGVLVVDNKGAIAFHNQRFVEIWQIPSHLIEFESGSAIGADDAPILSTVLDRVKNPKAFIARVQELYDNPNLNDHCEIILRDGRTVERYSSSLYGDNGPHLGRVWFFRDITGHKQVEESLLMTQFVSDQAPDSIIWFDKQARIVYANEATCRERGYTKEELLVMSIPDIDPDFPADVWLDHWQELKQKGNLTFESRHRCKDDTIFPIEVSANFVKFEGKEFNVAFIRDITERKLHEDQILGNEQHLLDILKVSPIAVRIATKQGREVVFYNPRYADLIKNIHVTGYDPKKYYVRVEDYDEVLAELAEGKTVINRLIELRIPDSSNVWALASYMPIKYKDEDAVLGWFYDISERRAAEEEIKNLAFFDPLTGLPNRRLLLDRLQHALSSSVRSDRHGALLFIDLDNFKTLNDTLGHDKGDLLLQLVARRLECCLREGDSVARLGGDEFVVLLEDLSEHAFEAAAQTETVGEKILASINQTYQLASHEYHCTPSIGASLFAGVRQTTEDLMKQADIAMYQAKKAGRNTLRFFDPQMQDSINTRVALEGDLRNALERKQFQLYYQIQLDSAGRPSGAEALIRWIHPERGLVLPAQFIPLAEETELILPIGQWVLETACAQIKVWESDERTQDFVLAVNISAMQIRQADFVAQVQAAIACHAINPKRLKLELTESVLMENIENTIEIMNTLKAIGVQFSLDDFGTGYSSLQYLKRLPLDQIKIDQSFVHDLASDNSNRAIVRAIIAMAHGLGLDVIAEGVETAEQRHFLLSKGCTDYQGYLFARPIPIGEFEVLLRNDFYH